MKWLADTNVLLRSVQTAHPMYGDASRAVTILLDRGDDLCVIAQNPIEFWAVVTRPIANNGFGLTVAQAVLELTKLKANLTLLPDTTDILSEWEQLVVKHQVQGKQAHDARLVAAMLVLNVTHLLTFNTADFKRYNEVTVVDPASVK